MPLRHRIWMTLESPSFSRAAFWYAQFSLLIIMVSTLSFCLETELNCKEYSIAVHAAVTEENCQSWVDAWYITEIIAVVCFTGELLVRFLTTPSPWLFVRGVMNWVDLVAILPFFIELAVAATASSTSESGSGEDDGGPLQALSVFRVIRLVRVFRVFKMGKSSSGMKMMASTMLESAKVLFVLVFMVGIAVVVFSAAVYSFEQSGSAASDFESIPRTFWWALVTMTTVGYGDITPMTNFGRLVAVFTMFSGIIIVALPITVIGANFEKQYEKQFFQDAIVEECSTHDGYVNYVKLRQILHDLHVRGNLRIPLPEDDEELKKLVDQYALQEPGKLDPEDWGAFLVDNVFEAHEFTDVTIQKVVADVHELKQDMAEMHAFVAGYREASDAQFLQLRALICGEKPPETADAVLRGSDSLTPSAATQNAREILAAAKAKWVDSPSSGDSQIKGDGEHRHGVHVEGRELPQSTSLPAPAAPLTALGGASSLSSSSSSAAAAAAALSAAGGAGAPLAIPAGMEGSAQSIIRSPQMSPAQGGGKLSGARLLQA